MRQLTTPKEDKNAKKLNQLAANQFINDPILSTLLRRKTMLVTIEIEPC